MDVMINLDAWTLLIPYKKKGKRLSSNPELEPSKSKIMLSLQSHVFTISALCHVIRRIETFFAEIDIDGCHDKPRCRCL
jgi:hypothetical protein